MKIYRVYLLIFPNGKMYCGASSENDIRNRWRNGYGYYTQRLVGPAVKEFGWKNIEHKIVAEFLNRDEALQLEKEIVEKYHLTNIEFGYNIYDGGNHYKMLEVSKKLLSKARKGQHNSPETEFKKGHKSDPKAYIWTAEKRLKQSLSHKGKHSSPKTEFTSESVRGAKNPRAYGVYQYTLDLKFVAYYETALEASQKTGINRGAICNCRCGTKKSAGGFKWFKNKLEEISGK